MVRHSVLLHCLFLTQIENLVDENAHHDLYEVLLHWHHVYLIARIGDVNDRQGGGTGRMLTKCSDQ